MLHPRSISFVILARHLEASIAFYHEVAGLEIRHQDTVSATLGHSADPSWELVLMDEVSEFVPKPARGMTGGCYLQLVVEDVDAACRAAARLGLEIVETPHGPTEDSLRAIIRDPSGLVVDIATPAARDTERPEQRVA